jgi:hypothetical protein
VCLGAGALIDKAFALVVVGHAGGAIADFW